MKYEFTGHRGDISLVTGHMEPLAKGDQFELTDEQAEALIANDFPIQPVNPEEVTAINVEL